ncbi:MAG TPA: hypothetical protein VN365_05665 [Candidatus Thermoplasmatota archaeon]|nr:hypothetical protein [Candidatus Thermoplasmatota archaeon]
MDRNPIIRKYVTVGIIFLFIGVCITPAIAQVGEGPSLPTRRSAQKTDIGLSGVLAGGFALESVISLSWNANETEEPLKPGGAPQSVNITVTYQVLASSFLGRLILLYCLVTHQYATVTVKTGDVPSWCTASLSDSELQFPITGDASSQFITLTVAVNEYAPHYVLKVPIQASADTKYGPFGFLRLVNDNNQTGTLDFLIEYRPCLIVIPENDTIAVIPNESSYLRISITNAGNARTVVHGNIVYTPPDWIQMMTDQIMLEVNMTGYAYLFVVPPVNFNGTDTIILSFTPYLADDYSQHGDPVYVLIRVIYEP